MERTLNLRSINFDTLGFSVDYLAKLFADYGYENIFFYDPANEEHSPDVSLDREALYSQVERRIASSGKYFTHSGTFHADDVVAAGLMKIMFPDASLVRCDSEAETKKTKDFVFDIGMGPFDHHQKDKKCEDFAPCSAWLIFNLLFPVWVERRLGLCKNGYRRVIDDVIYDMYGSFFLPLSLTDNFGQAKHPNTLAYLLTPNSGSLNEFVQASLFTGSRLLERFSMLTAAELSTACIVREAEKGNGKPKAIRMDDNSFFSTFGFPSYIKYVMFKSNRDEGCFNIVCLNDAKLPELPMSKVSFIHPNGFMCVVNDPGVFDTWFNPLIVNHESAAPFLSAEEIRRRLQS